MRLHQCCVSASSRSLFPKWAGADMRYPRRRLPMLQTRGLRLSSTPGPSHHPLPWSGGSLQRAMRTDSTRYAVDTALQYGGDAEVLGPAAARREAGEVVSAWLDFYRRHTK